MKILRSVTVIAVVAAMLAPSAALAQAYPRHVTIDGMDCIQQPGRDGIETWCRQGEGPPMRVQTPTTPPPGPDPSLRYTDTVGRGWAPNPHTAATQAAAREGTGGRFVGGMGLGILLGPLGWVIGGLDASSSTVSLPPLDPRWTPQQQTHYAVTYTSEVRRRRTTAAVLGGVTGSVVLATVVILATSGGGD